MSNLSDMFTNLDHVNVVVRDISTLRAFYADVLGLTVLSEFDISEPALSAGLGIPNTELRVIFWAIPGTTTRIEMVQYLREPDSSVQSGLANTPGYGHLALAVNDIHAAYRTIAERGAAFVSEPVLVGGNTWFCFMHDPEGNIVELIAQAGDTSG